MIGGELNRSQSTRIAGGAIVGGLFVKKDAAGDQLVIQASAQGEAVDGVAMYDAASGEAVGVVTRGECEMVCGDTVTKGDRITTGADARVETAASGDAHAGYALTSAADGEAIRVFFDPALTTV